VSLCNFYLTWSLSVESMTEMPEGLLGVHHSAVFVDILKLEYNQKSFYDNSSSHSLTLYCNSNCMNSVNSVITTNMFLQEELRGWKLGWTFQKCFEIPFKILSTANLFERKISRKVSESLLIIKPSNVKWKCKLPIYLFTKYLNGHLNIWDVSWFFAESLSWSSISFAPRAKT
jgi:hypothetical protein